MKLAQECAGSYEKGMLPTGMDGIDLQDYVCGGYYLARPRCFALNQPVSSRLPLQYFSASGCINHFFPAAWVWCGNTPVEGTSDYKRLLEFAERFGITPQQLPDVIHWGQTRLFLDFGMPHGFSNLTQARRALEWISLPASEYVIFGIGLHGSLKDKLQADTIQNHDFIVPQCIQEGRNLSAEGVVLGHELLNYEYGEICHSWICNGLEHHFAGQSQFAINQNGYISTFDNALACARKIESRETGAEPGPWYPWLIVRYD